MTWLYLFIFLLDFVLSYAWCGCFIVYLRFQVMEIKSELKKTFLKKTFGDIFGQLHTQECKAKKK